jgi:hypothetical protein
MDVVERPGGFDVIYTFVNDTNEPLPLGSVRLGVITLGENIRLHNFKLDGQEEPADFDGNPTPGVWSYPLKLYSPIGVIKNDDYAIGVSLLYPVLQYKHEAAWRLWSPGGANGSGEGGRGWAMEFKFSNFGWENENSMLSYPGVIPPGEERVYTMCVRVTRNPDDWMRTLLPYRDYFRSQYGEVQYQRDPTPVRQLIAAGSWATTDENPLGMVQEDRRPDIHGWGPWADYLREVGTSWRRAVVWKPSGVFRENISLNFPFQFTSNWMNPAYNMDNAVQKLSTVPSDNFQFGLWWGRAAQVMYQWDTPHYEGLNPNDPEHVQRGFAELDLAGAAGATIVGLDQFSHLHTAPWKLIKWLELMQERQPQIKFVTEARRPDIFHVMAPTYIKGFLDAEHVDSLEELYQVNSPLYLADFLLPGHETWVAVEVNLLEAYYGRPPTLDEAVVEIQRFASMGYVPLIWSDLVTSPDESFNAAESWNETVPEDLRLPPPNNQQNGP